MKPEIDSAVQQRPETTTSMVDSLGPSSVGIKLEDSIYQQVSASIPSDERKLNPVDVLNGAQPPEAKAALPPPMVQQPQQVVTAVMQNPNISQAVAGPLHPLHQAPGVPQLPNPAALTAQHVAAVDNNACAVPEFELARRLGVRFDSSNAAWVAR